MTRESGIRPCEGDCGKMTRPNNTKPIDGVHTVLRATTKFCYPCSRKANPDFVSHTEKRRQDRIVQQRLREQLVQSDYRTFLARRQERMAAAERRRSWASA